MRNKPADGKLAQYLELTKPRIVSMVTLTAVMGYVLAPGEHPFSRLLAMVVGLVLSSAGASALNHCLERDTDKLMERTRYRPIPMGQISPLPAMIFGITLVLAGVFWLNVTVNLLSSFLVLLTAFLYVLVYTPLKRLTWFNTFVGSVPGALPPVVGWAAAAGQVDWGAYFLFLILFTWQHPHFFALAWIYREDYARGGMQMLPVIDPDGRRTIRHILLYCVILLAVSILPFYFGMAGHAYLIGALLLGVGFFAMAVRFAREMSLANARTLFRSSLVYFPVILGMILIDANF